MSFPNIPPSQRTVPAGKIDPQSASTAKTSDWVSMVNYSSVLALLKVGTLGASGTVDAKLQQATDASGTNAKDIANKSITQLTKAGTDDNKMVALNVHDYELDRANNFTHVALVVTPATAASLIDATLFGFDAANQPAAAATALDETIY